MYKVEDVANWFLANSEQGSVTNKKLQKLVYYAYSWYLVFNNEKKDDIKLRLFENKFQAWVHGAVYPELYYKYKNYGSAPISQSTKKTFSFSEDDIDILEQVLEVYGKYNGNQLEDICHQELPWINARKGLRPYDISENKILDDDIFECYSARL